jgi:hypothetical protein
MLFHERQDGDYGSFLPCRRLKTFSTLRTTTDGGAAVSGSPRTTEPISFA